MFKPVMTLAIAMSAYGAAQAQTAETPAALPADPAAAQQAYIDRGFAAMDADGDGNVTRAEFRTFMEGRLERQKARFDAAFQEADKNGDGKLDKEEAAASNALLAQRFDSIDSDQDGFITPDEIRAATLAEQARYVK